MADGIVSTNKLEQIFVDGDLAGYLSTYVETGRRFTIEYDLNFNVKSETIEELYQNLKTLEEMPQQIRDGFSEAVSLLGKSDTSVENYGFVEKNEGQTIQIIYFGDSPDGDLIGRVNVWKNENSWDGWQGRVRNESEGYDLHDAEWNYLASSYTDDRYVTPDSGVEYLDESYSSVHFNIEEPADDASEAELAAWAELNPQTESIDWASVDVVRSGESSWTQYTPEGDEENSNTESRVEFFERVDVDYDEDEADGHSDIEGVFKQLDR